MKILVLIYEMVGKYVTSNPPTTIMLNMSQSFVVIIFPQLCENLPILSSGPSFQPFSLSLRSNKNVLPLAAVSFLCAPPITIIFVSLKCTMQCLEIVTGRSGHLFQPLSVNASVVFRRFYIFYST